LNLSTKLVEKYKLAYELEKEFVYQAGELFQNNQIKD